MNQTIRVLALIQSYHSKSYGGAEKQLEALAPLLKVHNIDLHVLTRGDGELPTHEDLDGVTVYRTPYTKIPGLRALLYLIDGLNHIRKIRPDVLHVHGLFSTATTAVWARRLFGIPSVAKVLRGGTLGDIIRLKAKPFGKVRMTQLSKLIDGFVVISEEIRTELLSEGVPETQCHYIPNGVDIERFRPLSPDQKRQQRAAMGLPDVLTVIYTGRLVAAKRINHLIESWQTVNQKLPAVQLLIIGRGSDKEALEAQAGDGIRFIGSVENVAEWLQIADLFVLPSVSEGLSNSLLEAMATELPIVSTAVGAAPNLIEPGVNGWCIPPDDIPALTSALLEALGSLDRIPNYGKNNRQRILNDYQLAVTACKLCELYETVIQRAK